MSKVTIKLDKFEWNDDKVKKLVESGSISALGQAAEQILDTANEYVPYDTGELKRSGRVVKENNGLEVGVTYDAEHAVPVHETPANYQGGKRHKFLERAVQDHQQEILEALKKGLQSAFK